jgi:hypothetical protein
MTDGIAQPVAGRTTTLTLLTDWPLSKPNRDLNGDQKAAVIGGVRRHILSSANRKALWRRVLVPGSLRWLAERSPETYAGRFSMSVRTKYVADKLIADPMLQLPDVSAALSRLGIERQDHRTKLVELGEAVFNVLQKGAKKANGKEQAANQKAALEKADDEAPAEAEDVKRAIAAYGLREMREIRGVLADRLRYASKWDAVLNGTKKDKKSDAEAEPGLAALLSQDEKLAVLWGLSRIERLGIDGALFGTMVTQDDYRVAAPSAVQVSHSITVHRAFDFETLEIARDDLEDGPGAAILMDASYASGLYLTSVTIDHAQLIENVMAPEVSAGKGKWQEHVRFRSWHEASEDDVRLAGELARAVVVSILYTTDHAMQTQTNARVMPAYVLAETGSRGTLNHAGAFSRPVGDQRGNNSILVTAVTRLRDHASRYDQAYHLVDQRAELLVAPDLLDSGEVLASGSQAAGSWKAERIAGAESLADWVQGQVRPAAAR